MQLFQFLIGNNDYSVIRSEDDFCCHNVDVLGTAGHRAGVIPVPFDFDMSGLVNAAYAAPPAQVPVADVRWRYFYGLCQPDDVIDAAVATLQSKREEIVSLVANLPELDKRNRAKSLQYVREFYDILDTPSRFREEIIERCRGRIFMERMLAESKG